MKSRVRWPARRLLIPSVIVLLGMMFLALLAHQGTEPSPPKDSSRLTQTPAIRQATPFAMPDFLQSYQIVVTDFTSGDIALLGQSTLITGGGPHGLAWQPGQRYLWSMNASGFNVWVIDAASHQIVASIPAGPAPVHAVFSPDGRTAYISDFGGSTITVVDTVTRRTIGTITTPDEPHGMAISSDGATLYVACVSGSVVIIDTRSRQIVATVSVPGGAAPYGVALSPDGKRLVVTDETFGDLDVIDTATDTLLGPIVVGARPALVTWIPQTHWALVANNGDGTVSIVDPYAFSHVKTLLTGAGPHGVTASPDGKWLFVANTRANTITVIDAQHLTMTAQIPVGNGPIDIAVSLRSHD
jgi:YVTN family beta-propeller protein